MFETKMGENLYVLGSIEELGNWQDFTCKMTWTDGHIWVTNDLFVSASHFLYKYVVKSGESENPDEKGELTWESGYDRIADLAILPNMS